MRQEHLDEIRARCICVSGQEVEELVNEIERLQGCLREIRSGIGARFTDRAGWGPMIDAVLNR